VWRCALHDHSHRSRRREIARFPVATTAEQIWFDTQTPPIYPPRARAQEQVAVGVLPHFSGVRRQDHRRYDATGISVLFGFCTELLQVFERKFRLLHGRGSCGCRETGPLPEHHEIEQ
jgi:hypothetical protein